MGLYQGKKKAEKAFAAVPASLRNDPSYMFSRALYLRRSKQATSRPPQVMAEAPRDPELLVDGDEWWAERRLITRELLDKGDPKTAYEVASHHGAESPAQQIEAEFHAGWIALRFLNDPANGSAAFRRAVAQTASTPISISRVAYWQGRAAEAAGEREDARIFYRSAPPRSRRPITGSWRSDKLGEPMALRQVGALDRRTSARPSRPARRSGPASCCSRSARPSLPLGLYTDLAQTLDDPGAARRARPPWRRPEEPARGSGRRQDRRRSGVSRSISTPIRSRQSPISRPVGDDVEPAMVYAIARQESAFNPRAHLERRRARADAAHAGHREADGPALRCRLRPEPPGRGPRPTTRRSARLISAS